MITGTITPDDYLAAQRLHRDRCARWPYALGALAVVFGFFVWFISRSVFGLLLVAMGSGAVIGEAVTNLWVLPRRARKLHHQHKDFAHPFTYSWDADTIEAKGGSGHSQRRWNTYHKVRENEHIVLLYHSDNLFEMFPKRWFPETSVLAQFLSLARNAKQT